MAIINNIYDLIDYSFQKLGAPVINIAVDAAQAEDRVNDALEFYFERHYAGYNEVFIKKIISQQDVINGYLTFDNKVDAVIEVLKTQPSSSANRLFDMDWRYAAQTLDNRTGGSISEYYMTMSHLSLIRDMFTTEKSYQYNRITSTLVPNFKLNSVGGSNLISTLWADYTNTANATINDKAVNDYYGRQIASTIQATQTGLNTFTTTYDSKGAYLNGIRTLVSNFRSDSYTGNIDIVVTDSKGTAIGSQTIVVTDRWNTTTNILEMTWDKTLHVDNISVSVSFTSVTGSEIIEAAPLYLYYNAMLVLRAYQALDPQSATEVYNDRWIKAYATALIKQQWGSNLKKYDGVQLPGGVTMNGQTMFDEAVIEIEKLEEDFSLKYELPSKMVWA